MSTILWVSPTSSVHLCDPSCELTRERCLMIIDWIKDAFFFELFAEPVDWLAMGLHDYLSIVKQPMDFTTLAEYTSSDEFVFSDWVLKARLIWTNACLYNPPENAIHDIAKRLGDLFERKVSEAQTHPNDEDPRLISNIFYTLVSALSQEEIASAFCEPVDVSQVNHYPSIISMPMSFNVVLERLENDFYLERHHIESDINRIWENAILFNPTSSVYHMMATKMQSLSNRLFASRHEDTMYVPACTKMQLVENMESITDVDRISVMKQLQDICSDAIVDVQGTSVITIDMLNRAQFFRLDMFVRRLCVTMCVTT